jgi:hypothetical protein
MSSQPDCNRSSVQVLLRALERNDQGNLTVLSRAVLRSTYDHLLLIRIGSCRVPLRSTSPGQIVGVGTVNGQQYAFLLTPQCTP